MSRQIKKKTDLDVTVVDTASIQVENKKISNPRKKKEAITTEIKVNTDTLPVRNDIICVDQDGIKWRYKPGKNITAYEVARLLPVFTDLHILKDQWTYIKQYKLERNFERIE
jgi:hypothetical protein